MGFSESFVFLKVKLIYWLMLASFGLHVFIAFLPSPSNTMVADEPYYLGAAQDMLRGVASNFEHPPLVKAILALSIALFGNNWVAWRLPIIMFSLLATYLTYKIAREFLSEQAATYAAALLTLSVIFLFIGSIALLDIPSVAFGLAGVYFALRSRYGWSGLMFALSFLSKELAVLMFTATLIYLVIKRTNKWKLVYQCSIAFTVAFVGLWIYDVVLKPSLNGVVISNPVSSVYYMAMHYVTLIRSHAWYPPVSWVTPFGNNAWNPMVMLSWYLHGKLLAVWVIQPNAAVEYMTIPLLLILPILIWKRRDSLATLSWLWIALTFLPWLMLGFFVKTEVNYYIVYTVPFLAIGSAYLWSTIKNKKLKYALATLQLTVGATWFIYYLLLYPLVFH